MMCFENKNLDAEHFSNGLNFEVFQWHFSKMDIYLSIFQLSKIKLTKNVKFSPKPWWSQRFLKLFFLWR